MMLQKRNYWLSLVVLLMLLGCVHDMTIRPTHHTVKTTVQPTIANVTGHITDMANMVGKVVGALAGIGGFIGMVIGAVKAIRALKKRRGVLSRLQTTMKLNYKLRYGKMPLIPWDETSKVSMDSVYIPIKLKEERDSSANSANQWEEAHNQTNHKIEQVIKKYRTDGGLRLIISAKPGCGKSTLCRQLMYDWSKTGSYTSQKYDLVILLKARDFSTDQDLSSAILENTINSFSMKDKLKEQIEEKIMPKEDIKKLIVIDGYDELKDKNQQKDLDKLLNNYDNCDLIVTTRPWCLSKLMSFEGVDKVVNISPFADEDITHFARKFFKHDNNHKSGVIEAFQRELISAKVEDLAREPLTLVLLCAVFKDRKSLPNIRTHLYEKLLQILEKTYNIKIKDIPETELKDFDKLLLDLGKLAFDKLTQTENGVLVFEELEVKKYVDLETALDVGLLTKTDPPQAKSDNKVSLLTDECDKFYMFLHLSIQECLAARYFYETSIKFGSNKKFKKFKPSGQLHFFLQFVCGYLSLDKDVNGEKLNRINSLTRAIEADSSLECKLWRETGCNPLFKWVHVVIETIRDYYNNVSDVNQTENKLCVERAIYVHLSGDDFIDTEKSHITKHMQCEQSVVCLKNACKALDNTHTLEEVTFSKLNCDCTDKEHGLSQLIKNNKNIWKIGIRNCDLTPEIAKSISAELTSLRKLTDVDLSHNQLAESVYDITNNLPKTIKTLILVCCGMTAEHVTRSARALSKLNALFHLDLSDNDIADAAEAVITKLEGSKIRKLGMVKCGITRTVAEGMAPGLSKLKALNYLYLSGNPIGGGAVDVVANLNHSHKSVFMHLLHTNTDAYVHMNGCKITMEDAINISAHLNRYKDWSVKLDLGGNGLEKNQVELRQTFNTRIELDLDIQ